MAVKSFGFKKSMSSRMPEKMLKSGKPERRLRETASLLSFWLLSSFSG